MKLHGNERIYQVVIVSLIGILLLISMFPLIYVVSMSMTSEGELMERGSTILFPLKPSFAAYERVVATYPNTYNAFGVSVLRTLIGTACSLSMTMVVGYAVSRRDMPGSRTLMKALLFTSLFSGGMIPTFLVVQNTGIFNTFWAMIIPDLVVSWNALVFKQFFQNLPYEIEEAASIDGVGKTGLMMRIVFPMSLPVVAAIGLFIAVHHWNSWFDALIYISDAKLQPLQLIIYVLNNDNNLGYNANDATVSYFDVYSRAPARSIRMAVTVIGVVPILCVYPFLQKYFVKGVYTGAVKG